MSKTKAIVVFIFILVLTFAFMRFGTEELPASMVGENITLFEMSMDDKTTGLWYLDVPFEAENAAVRYLNITIDGEIVARNVMPIVSKDEHLRFPFRPKTEPGVGSAVTFYYSHDPLPESVFADGVSKITFTSEGRTVSSVIVDHLDAALYIDKEGNKRTGAVVDGAVGALAPAIVYAQSAGTGGDGRPDFYGHRNNDVPDHDQEYNECGPTSVANSFTWLAKQYGFEELMPEDINSTIDELKADMEWDSGVKDEDVLPGKQMFVDRHKLPIEVHQIGSENDPDIHYKIYEELKKGQAVELAIQFYDVAEDGTRTKAGGHMVSVSGVQGGPDWMGIRLSDSATENAESGSAELYEFKDGKIMNYWGGDEAVVQFAFAQSPIQSVIDGTWTAPSGNDFLVGQDHTLYPGGDVVTKGISRFGFFNSFVDHPGDHFLGERFTVAATVVMREGERQWMFWTDDEGRSNAYWHRATGPWTLDGVMTGGGPLSPGRLVGRPTKTRVDGNRYRIEQDFVCVQPGTAKVSYEANVTWTVQDGGTPLPKAKQERYEEQLRPEASFQIDSPLFRCLTTDPNQIQEEPRTDVSEAEPEEKCGITVDPSGVEVEVLKLDGECYPKVQFTRAGSFDPCQAPHWHGGKVTSLTGKEIEDEFPDACGFGKIGEVPEDTVKIDQATAARYLGHVFDDVDLSEPEPESFEVELDLSRSYKGYGDTWDYEGYGEAERVPESQ